MRLTQNFTLAELVASQTATRRGLDNSPSPEHIQNLKLLAENILQPVRNKFGPTMITSGYRSPDLNRAIGGSTNSQHSNGQAADFKVSGVSNLVVAQWIRDNLDFDQLILEGHDPRQGVNSGWVHCSYRTSGNRKSVLTATFVGGRANYSAGLNV